MDSLGQRKIAVAALAHHVPGIPVKQIEKFYQRVRGGLRHDEWAEQTADFEIDGVKISDIIRSS